MDASAGATYLAKLVGDMRATGEFFGDRLTVDLVQRVHGARLSQIRPCDEFGEPSGSLFGHVARVETADPLWQEYALAYVRPDKEGNGVLREMTQALMQGVPPHISLFAITKRTPVMKVLMANRFIPATASWLDVEEFRQKVGLEQSRVPPSARSLDLPHPQEGTRYLFIRRAGQ